MQIEKTRLYSHNNYYKFYGESDRHTIEFSVGYDNDRIDIRISKYGLDKELVCFNYNIITKKWVVYSLSKDDAQIITLVLLAAKKIKRVGIDNIVNLLKGV